MSRIDLRLKSALPAFFQATGLKPFSGDAAYATAKGVALENGDAYYNTTTNEIRVYDADGAVWKTVLTAENDGTFVIEDTTNSTSKDTGSLVTEGGVGVEQDVFVGGKVETIGDVNVGNDLDVTGNATIDGDLTVSGTTTTVDTATLDVTDANITVNKGGTEASADDVAGLTVEMSDATDAVLIYDNDATSKWKVGETGSEKEVTTISDTQTLTNKTMDFSATGSNTITADAVDIDYDNSGSGLVATQTQAAIDEVDGNLDSHILDTTTHGTTGNIVGTTDAQTLTNKTINGNNNTISNLEHGAEVDNPSSGVHGVTGSVVGTSDAQTLTNKSIDADSNTITNIDNADIKVAAAIDAAKIADGSVSNAEFQRLDGVTSDIQTQLDGKASTTLNNLGTTSINADLLPDSNGTRALGSSSARMGDVYIQGDINTYNNSGVQVGQIQQTGGTLFEIITPADVSFGGMRFTAGNDTTADASEGQQIEVFGGAKTAGTGDGGPLLFRSGSSTGGKSGDITIETNSTGSTRGDILMVDGSEGTVGHIWTSTDANGRGEWQAPANPSIRSETATFTAAITDDVIFVDASSGSFTVDLPTASGNSGKIYEVTRTDTDWSNTVTIDPNASETIGGSSTTTLNTDNERLKFISDGTNWLIMERTTVNEWRSFTPTGAWTTNVTYDGYKRRVGDTIEIKGRVDLTGAPNSVQLSINIPDSLTMDSTKHYSIIGSGSIVGMSDARDNSAAASYAGVIRGVPGSNVVFVRMLVDQGSREDYQTVDHATPFTFASGDNVTFQFSFPISEWNA